MTWRPILSLWLPLVTLGWPTVTYSDLHWPTVTYSDPKVTYSDPKVTYSNPKVTYIDSTHLLLPLPTSPGPYWAESWRFREVRVGGWWWWEGGSTKFNVKHQGKDIHHPPSTIYKWPLSDLPGSTLCPSLSLSFTIIKYVRRFLCSWKNIFSAYNTRE